MKIKNKDLQKIKTQQKTKTKHAGPSKINLLEKKLHRLSPAGKVIGLSDLLQLESSDGKEVI